MSAPHDVTIHQRMGAILAALPAIGKTQKNTQQNFMFRGHDDVLNALNPLLAEHGVFVVPDVVERVTAQRTTSKGSVMFEVNLHVAYTFWGAAGDSVTASAWGEGTDMGDKATNKAMTMAFKNVLNQAFAINTAETIDADAHTPEESQPQQAQRFAPPASVPAPDPHGLHASRADAEPPTDGGEPALVQVFFGKNTGVPLGELTPAQRKFYAEKWAPNDPNYPVGAKERRLRVAARILCGLPATETEGPFAPAAVASSDDDIPF